jgi:hypothetical protein
MEVVATMFRTGKAKGTKVQTRYFNSKGKALGAMNIGKDNFGIFEGSFMS